MVLQNALWLDFPTDAAEYLDSAAHKMLSDPQIADLIREARQLLFHAPKEDFLEKLRQIASKTEIHPYTVDMVFLLLCVDGLLEEYRERGLSKELCREILTDLKYKEAECQSVYGIHGTFVADWFCKHFRCELFQLGRLQYERFPFPYDAYGTHLKKGDTVYKCHIPSCGPLREESVIDSFQRAYRFFESELRDSVMPIFCSSWMLYPPHDRYVFPKGSNLNRFFELFEIVAEVPMPQNEDFWRIFNQPFNRETLASAPTSTSLQRGFKQYLESGHCMGSGKGILLFDGEKILPKEKT